MRFGIFGRTTRNDTTELYNGEAPMAGKDIHLYSAFRIPGENSCKDSDT